MGWVGVLYSLRIYTIEFVPPPPAPGWAGKEDGPRFLAGAFSDLYGRVNAGCCDILLVISNPIAEGDELSEG